MIKRQHMTYQVHVYDARAAASGVRVANQYRYSVIASGGKLETKAAYQAADATDVDPLFGAAVIRLVAVDQSATYTIAERAVTI